MVSVKSTQEIVPLIVKSTSDCKIYAKDRPSDKIYPRDQDGPSDCKIYARDQDRSSDSYLHFPVSYDTRETGVDRETYMEHLIG